VHLKGSTTIIIKRIDGGDTERSLKVKERSGRRGAGGPGGALRVRPGTISRRLSEGDIAIAVVGLGRIGMPTAALFARAGAKVVGYDTDRRVVAETNAGRCRFADEPGLGEMVAETVRRGRLRATDSADEAFSGADFIVLCVPTPVDDTKTPDYSAVHRAAEEAGKRLRRGVVMITESTVGPGVVEEVIGSALEKESGLRASFDFGLASCPERSDPGKILKDMRTIPRIIGSTDERCTDVVAELYEKTLGVKAIRVSSPRTANAVKLTENIFRDVNIALSNEFAVLFEKLGIDAKEVIDACATKYNFVAHYPGAGVGGSCLPSNSYYLIAEGMKAGNIPYLVRMGREINDRMPEHVVELASEALNRVGKTVRGSKVAILGIAYKPDVRDVQLTPLEPVARRLLEMGARVEAYDPMFKGETVLGHRVAKSALAAADGADCIVLGTAHSEFKRLDLDALSKVVGRPAAFVDARNAVNPTAATGAGFVYSGVGRKLMAAGRTPG
jgi:nucleotide sugar dehydrogenase